MIEIAKAQVPDASFEVCDSRNTPEEPRHYDAITSYFGWLAAISRDEIRQIFQKVYRNLKPGGLFVFATVPADIEDEPRRFLGHNFRMTSMTQEQFEEAIKSCGFEILKIISREFHPNAVEAGICDPQDEQSELELFIYAKKPNLD